MGEPYSDFLNDLKGMDYRYLYYQDENFYRSSRYPSWLPTPFYEMFKRGAAGLPERDEIAERDLGDVKYYCSSTLANITGNFDKEYLVTRTLFGRLFRAKIQQKDSGKTIEVFVKTWDFHYPDRCLYIHYPSMFSDEIKLLMNAGREQKVNFAKLIGYCFKKQLAVVYVNEGNRFLSDVLVSENFMWADRMKFAIQLALQLQIFHSKDFILGVINSGHLFVDETYNLVLYEFGLMSHVPDKILSLSDESGFKPTYAMSAPDAIAGVWSKRSDVYAFGEILLQLIKREDLHHSGGYLYLSGSVSKFSEKPESLVHEHFKVDQDVGLRITKLAISCLNEDPQLRHDIGEIIQALQDMQRINWDSRKRKGSP